MSYSYTKICLVFDRYIHNSLNAHTGRKHSSEREIGYQTRFHNISLKFLLSHSWKAKPHPVSSWEKQVGFRNNQKTVRGDIW